MSSPSGRSLRLPDPRDQSTDRRGRGWADMYSREPGEETGKFYTLHTTRYTLHATRQVHI